MVIFMRPIIGVVARPYMTDNGRYAMCILDNVRNSIIRSGGIPLLILPTQDMNYCNNNESSLTDTDKEILDNQISLCDGILMPGGDKIYFYDYYICSKANELNIPLLGICMGMQLMCNYNNNNKNVKVENHKEPNLNYVHNINISKDSILFNIIKKDKINVNSLHNYTVPNSGDYEVCGKCNNIIEAIEKKDSAFNIGVQWHPERNYDENDQHLFNSFITACQNYRENKDSL